MKKLIKAGISLLSITMVCIALSSFTLPGGEGFEVYLNQKVILQQFGKNMDNPGSLSLEKASANDELTVKYHRCNNTGTNRVFTIRDAKNTVLKQWKFSNENDRVAVMTCKVKDIVNLQKGKEDRKFSLYYSSSEIPQGKLLTNLVVNQHSNATAAR